MAALDDELLLDAQDDAQAVAFIKAQLPAELQDRLDDETLYYCLDVIIEYLAESGVLDAQPDKDGYIDIDLEQIAAHLSAKAKKEGIGNFTPEEMLFVVQAQMDYEDSKEE